MPGPDLLERIDRAIAELQAIRDEVAASLPVPVEVDGVGVKRGGRWLASAPRLARYLNGK